MVNTDAMEVMELVDCLVFPDPVVPLEFPVYPDPKDTEVSVVSLENQEHLVLMDQRELWVTWEALELQVELDPVVLLEREDDRDLLDQLVFVV